METKLLLMYLKYAKELEINNFNTFKKELAIIQDYFRSYLYGKISYQSQSEAFKNKQGYLRPFFRASRKMHI